MFRENEEIDWMRLSKSKEKLYHKQTGRDGKLSLDWMFLQIINKPPYPYSGGKIQIVMPEARKSW